MAEKTPEKAPGTFSLLGTASTMGLHMVSGPIVGGGLGWLIDQGLDSWPVASAIGLVLGLVAGFRNVWADARYLERSNAAIDAERRKKEEEAENASKSVSNEQKTGVTSAVVPAFHKVVEQETEKPSPCEEKGSQECEESPEDTLTASILAGTAAPEEQELEELDETLEAIRRVLAGENEAERVEKRPENAGKEAV